LGNAFAAKKGQLSKPLKGTIISRFGKQKHPLFDHIYTYNNGIDIKASSGAAVRAVYNGSVVSVFTVPGNGNAVMLKHGEFYSTYSNLETVSVRRGDNLKTGAQLGTVGKDMNTGNYLLQYSGFDAFVSVHSPRIAELNKFMPKILKNAKPKNLTSPITGKIIRFKVQEGDEIKAGQELVIIEAMKMETSITADFDATVLKVLVAPGDRVEPKDLLVILQP
jgi:biotin carboxyl carrier protein